ncbi:hypothetical protein QWZ14_02435 [Paeniroseomonas aquatica]|uniref:Uncharacterized protein n=2 Tax=Paeniroseomonas aquatica TaxID=373043 RepID=A0ABT8A0I4_9PROT|nr:hypothetical protein [Paeniroseomonas aquatica]MDN3563235.1 hypothetical protein [Paeniroseomonas aquatica]
MTPAASTSSRAQQESWLADLPCPVLRLDSGAPLAGLAAAVLAAIPAAR